MKEAGSKSKLGSIRLEKLEAMKFLTAYKCGSGGSNKFLWKRIWRSTLM